jgi:hypothetical protein
MWDNLILATTIGALLWLARRPQRRLDEAEYQINMLHLEISQLRKEINTQGKNHDR